MSDTQKTRDPITSIESQVYIDTGIWPLEGETEEQYCDRAITDIAEEATDVDDDYELDVDDDWLRDHPEEDVPLDDDGADYSEKGRCVRCGRDTVVWHSTQTCQPCEDPSLGDLPE